MNRIEDWILAAELDLKGAKGSWKEGVANVVCFLAQQAVEKILKAAALRYTGKVPKIHVLVELLDRVALEQKWMRQFENKVVYLNRFYVPTRYPDAVVGSLEEGLPSMDEAKKALDYAGEVVEFIKGKLVEK